MVRALSERLHAARDGASSSQARRSSSRARPMLVGEEHVQLTRREAGVLAALASRTGRRWCQPTTLLRTVWW